MPRRRASGITRRWRALARDRGATTAIEFALLAPVLSFLVIGAAYFALALFQYSSLTEGVREGTRQLASALNDTTPYTDAVNALEAAAPALSTSRLSITLSVNGTACTGNSTCESAMSGAPVPSPVSITATYPCTVIVMGHNFLPNCYLSSTATEMIE